MNAPPPINIPPKPQSAPHLGMAIASLVLGILAFLGSVAVVGAFFGLIGIVLGGIHVSRRTSRNAMAWAGMVLCVLGIGISAVMGVVYFKGAKKLFKEVRKGITEMDLRFDKWQGVAAPDVTVTTIDGATIKLSELRGKRVVLYFWASWFPPCQLETPHVIRLRQEVSTNELVIIGISAEDARIVKAFAEKEHINFPNVSTANLPKPYDRVFTFPTMFCIDRKGVVQEVLTGYHEFEELKRAATSADYDGETKPPPAPEEIPEPAPEPEKTRI